MKTSEAIETDDALLARIRHLNRRMRFVLIGGQAWHEAKREREAAEKELGCRMVAQAPRPVPS